MVKLFVIPAREEPIAVILRRGPSRWYHVIQWNTRDDSFVHGAWIKGRIYEHKCDVSPNGRFCVYLVLQGSRCQTEFTHAWTAVSRVPWLHSLVVWPQQETWTGGGRFQSDKELTLRPTAYSPKYEIHPDYSPLRSIQIVKGKAPFHRSTNEVPDSDWCGHDHSGNVIFTRAGCLFRRQRGEDKLIADFADLTPDPRPAPEWATCAL